MTFRVHFARELAIQRRERHLSQSDFAELAGYSVHTVQAVEQALRMPSDSLARSADKHFGLLGALTRLAERARAETSVFEHYLDLEARATAIRLYDMRAVPGLLQRPAYARAAITAGDRDSRLDVDRLVSERLTRQERLTAPDPPRVHIVLDEAVLYRPIGGIAALREQLAALLDPPTCVEIQVLPYVSGAHGGIDGSISLLDFSDEPPALFSLGPVETLIDEPDAVQRGLRNYDRIVADALSPELSAELIAAVLEDT